MRINNNRAKTRATSLRDALNNAGLPHLADKVRTDERDLSGSDRKEIKSRVSDFDGYYRKDWKESETRAVLMELLGE